MVNYGVPLCDAAWIPVPPAAAAEESENRHVVLAGGDGAGRNAILLSAFDFQSNSLSDEPVARLDTGREVAFRIAVHPGGEGGLICSFPNGCRWFEWVETDEHTWSLVFSDNRPLEQLEDVGLQSAVTFNNEGTLLAVGGMDGKLRVFKWPDMEITLGEKHVHVDAFVRDLDFSPDGKFLVSLENGLARIWNIATSAPVASLPSQNDEIFFHARFSRSRDTEQVLYITTNRDKGGGRISKWNTSSWERISSTHVTRDRVSAFNVSPDGKLISVSINKGDILIVRCANMRVHSVVKKARLCPDSPDIALEFSLDSRALLSASMDSSARVTLIKDIKKRDGMRLWTMMLIILLAIAIYYARSKDFVPLKLL